MCGEKSLNSSSLIPAQGSPPHVRGKAKRKLNVIVNGGITPACAGKSPAAAWPVSAAGDHPRMCGEKKRTGTAMAGDLGSPPHVRGKGTCSVRLDGVGGITPACAGKSVIKLQRLNTEGDHPRMCGEKILLTQPTEAIMGSPPHVRGKVKGAVSGAVNKGITPACAGKSLCWQGLHC